MTLPSSTRELYQDVTRAARWGLAVNFALGTVKLIGGLTSGSFALLSDALNSLGDVVSSLVVLWAFRIAQQPADEEHPYGHARAETIAASNVALLLILSALALGWEALEHMGSPTPVPPAWILWIAAGNVVVKEVLYRYMTKVGRRTNSQATLANAWDHRSDALSAASVFVGLALVRWGGPAFHWADKAAALVVVVAIVWSGLLLFRQSASELLDVQADEQFVRDVRRVAEQVPGVRAVEKFWLRKTGLEYLADMHIQVDADLTVDAGHRIGHLVKDRLVAEFTPLRDVLVHLEPFPHGHQGDSK